MAILRLAGKEKKVSPPLVEREPFSPEDPGPAASSEPPVSPGRNRRILVVDDNAVVLKAFELKLRASGFHVFTTAHAAAVANTAEEVKAELIILDINFAQAGGGGDLEWNGFTIMQWLQRFPELAKIPVILISGENPEKYKARTAEVGPVAFFQKPVNYKELLAAILLVFGVDPGPSSGKP